MPALAAKILDQTHPDYKPVAMKRRKALYEGGEATRTIMKKLLPKMPQEPARRYTDRINRATYINYAGPICDFYAAYLFSKTPSIEVEGKEAAWYNGDDDEAEPGFVDNVDRRRSTWSQFWHAAFLDAAQNRYAYAWVNLPKVEEARENRLEQERAGDLEAYLVGLSAEDVIDWEEDETGELVWLMVKVCTDERASVNEKRKKVIRWTQITSTTLTVWEWKQEGREQKPKADDVIAEKWTGEHGLGELPVVRLELPKGYWLMERLNDPAMACFYAENDFAWASYMTAHALLYVVSKWQAQAPTIADGYYMQLYRDKEGNDEIGWLEIDGASHDVLRKRVTDTRQELYRIANQLALSSDQGAAEAARSGESKAMDYQSVAIVAKEFADILRSAMRKTIQLVSKMRDDGAAPKVGGLEGYDAIDVQAFIDAATAAKPLVKSETFRKVIAKRVVAHTVGETLEKDVLATIEEEIDNADYSVDEFAPFEPPSNEPDPNPDEGNGEDET